jgi:Holliday junction resolvase RusA-like endonuclease
MLRLHWSGIAISDNDRHRPGRGRIVATAEYKGFRDGLATMFCFQAHGQHFHAPDVRMQVALPKGSRKDRNNLIKAVCDALEIAGIIDNDRELNRSHFNMEPVQELPRGADDEITLLLSGGDDWHDRTDPGRETGGTD